MLVQAFHMIMKNRDFERDRFRLFKRLKAHDYFEFVEGDYNEKVYSLRVRNERKL